MIAEFMRQRTAHMLAEMERRGWASLQRHRARGSLVLQVTFHSDAQVGRPIMSTSRAWQTCLCGHLFMHHDIEEYDGDGSDMCCVEGCGQQGCPGRAPKQTEEVQG